MMGAVEPSSARLGREAAMKVESILNVKGRAVETTRPDSDLRLVLHKLSTMGIGALVVWAGGLARRSGLEAEVRFQDGQSKALAEEGEVLGFELVDGDAGDPVLLARTRPPHGRVGRPGEAALHLEVDQPEPVLEEELSVLSLELVDVHARTPALLAASGAPHGGEGVAVSLQVDQAEALVEELGVLSLELVDAHARTPALLAVAGSPDGGHGATRRLPVHEAEAVVEDLGVLTRELVHGPA